MGRPLATLPPAFETLCRVSGGSDGQGPGERGRRGHAGQGDGRDQEICECGSGQEPGSLPAGESVPAWARSEGGSAAAAADSGPGGEEEEREASLCSGQHGERPQQSRQGFHALSCEANINTFGVLMLIIYLFIYLSI